ncbi:MAG: hypothetical protein DIZ77_02195, partial [endosymbiont of Seepiophila jonesi]
MNKIFIYNPLCSGIMAREGKMNSAVAIHLTPQEQTALQKNVRSRKTSIRLIERSKIILLAADGLSNIEIAEQLNISAHKVGRWRNRYAELGLPG